MTRITRLAALVAFCLAFAAPAEAQKAQFTADPQATAERIPEMIPAMNAERTARGLAPLEPDAKLAEAAAVHAQEMARKGYLSHSSQDGRSMADRVRNAGFRYCFAAENIAFGQRDVAETVTAWMGSAGHRRNLLAGDATRAGAAVATAGGRRYWVAVYGRPC